MDLIVRPEALEDISAIYQVNQLAFDRENEARLVDKLRKEDAVILSLVAVLDGKIVGHILFSPVTITMLVFNGRQLGLDRWWFYPNSRISVSVRL